MKVAIITTDAREHYGDYRPEPFYGTAPEALLQGFAKIPEVEVHVLSCVTRPLKPTGHIAPNVIYHSMLVPSGTRLRSLYIPALRAHAAKLREIQPDIVHGQGTEKECALAAAVSGYPNLVTIHGNIREVAKILKPSLISPWRLQCALEGWTVKRAGGVLCLSNYTLRCVKDEARRTWVLPNAVNERYFSLQHSATPNNNVLCVANIDERKNQNTLIRALDPIAEKSGMRLVFLGGGPPESPYFKEFQSLVAARPWCSYEGFKKGAALEEHLINARVVVLPSREENCPMVVLESMAMGAPVAAARGGGTPELIDHGVDGLLFDPDDQEGMRAAVLELFNGGPKVRAIAEAGKKRARERHFPEVIARKHLDIYRDVLAKRAS